MIDPANRDIVHHLLMYECNPTPLYNDTDLPEGLCDDMYLELAPCVTHIAIGWAVGGDAVSRHSSFFVDERSCLNRLWNFPTLLDIQLEVILKSNIT